MLILLPHVNYVPIIELDWFTIRISDSYFQSSRLSMKKEKEEKTPCWSFSVGELKFSKPSVFHVVNESAE